MATENMFATTTIKAGQDLSSHRYKAVNLAGTVAATTADAKGVVRNAPQSGDHVELVYKGEFKVLVGAAVNSGAQVGVTTSGFFITVTGSAYVGVAKASASSGALCTVIGDFNMGLVA